MCSLFCTCYNTPVTSTQGVRRADTPQSLVVWTFISWTPQARRRDPEEGLTVPQIGATCVRLFGCQPPCCSQRSLMFAVQNQKTCPLYFCWQPDCSPPVIADLHKLNALLPEMGSICTAEHCRPTPHACSAGYASTGVCILCTHPTRPLLKGGPTGLGGGGWVGGSVACGWVG